MTAALALEADDPRDWWPADQGAPPLFATRRNPRLVSAGAEIALVSSSLGAPFLPWQRYTADVASERRPDGSLEYQVVLVSVPRQTGKTTLIRAVGTHRCLVCGRDVFYTAQTGKDARARWTDLVKALRASPAYAPRVQVALRAGAENVTFPNGAAFHAFAPTPESLHGYTPNTVVLDEAFKHSAATGELLMGAITPAQFTIPDRQLWIVSTAGTAESTFLHDWLDLGMTSPPRVATFLWGAREDQDPWSLEDIAAFHPGVGFQLGGKTITAHDVLDAAEHNTRAEYQRAYANRRTRTTADLIPADLWADLSWVSLGLVDELAPTPPATGLHLVYDVAQDRQSAGVVAAWRTTTGVRIKTVKHAPGTAWLAQAVEDLWRTLSPVKVRATGSGPVRAVTEQLAGVVPVDVLTETDWATASTRFLSMTEDRHLDHDGERALADSISGLVTRPDGIIHRRACLGDSSLGIAAAVATWSAATTTPDAGPLFQFGEDPQ